MVPPFRIQVLGDSKVSSLRRTQSSMNDVRAQNQQVVMEAILSEGLTSRKDLCRITGLSASTVGLIVNQFIEKGLLHESGAGTSERGRKPITIGINSSAGMVLAVDVNEMTACLYDLHLKEAQPAVEYPVAMGPEPEDVVALVKETLRQLPKKGGQPLVIGVSVPGLVDSSEGVVIRSSNLGWSNVALGSMVVRETGIPTVVESNMVALSLTEAWIGVASGVQNFAYIHVGWRGVGAGLVFDGQVHRGAHLQAAEIGHLQVDPEGTVCRCGQVGCLEAMASGRGIVLRAGIPLYSDGRDPESVAWDKLVEAAEAGEEKVLQALEETAQALGKAAAALVVVVDPNMVVFGGKVMELHRYIMPAVETVLRSSVPAGTGERLAVEVATDSREKSMAGAAHIALRSYLFSVA